MMALRTPKTSSIINAIPATIIETHPHIFACLAAFVAPWISPACAFLSTCKAKISERAPCGRQQRMSERAEATIARTRLFGTVAGAFKGGGGGMNGCDI